MNKWIKRLLAVVLTTMLLCGLVPMGMIHVNAMDVPVGYTGIYTPAGLDDVRNDLTGKYILMNDIDLSSWENWEPIMDFQGILDGNSHEIRGLTIDIRGQANIEDVGLFSNILYGEVKNLILVEVNIYVNASDVSSVGGIAGRAGEATFNNCSVHGRIQAFFVKTAYVGGIAGYVTGTSGIINDCWNNVRVDAYALQAAALKLNVGGITGYAETDIGNCGNSGAINVALSDSPTQNVTAYVGGIVGDQYNPVNNCWNDGAIKANISYTCYIGGITGRGNNNTLIFRCSNTGSITGYSAKSQTIAGGIAGSNSGTTTGYKARTSECWNTGAIKCETAAINDPFAGGIVGNGDSIENCWNAGSVSTITTYNSNSNLIDAYTGGIVGNLHNKVLYCYSRGTLSAQNSKGSTTVGGVAGMCWDSVITSTFWQDTTARQTIAGVISVHTPTNVNSLTAAQMLVQSNYINYDFSTIWKIVYGEYPHLRNNQNTNRYIVTYNANNGTGAPVAQVKIANITLKLSNVLPQRSGYVFQGWATTSSATTAEFQPGDNFTGNNNRTFYAVWKMRTNAEAVAADKASLTWDNIKGVNTAQNDVTGDLTQPLPSAGASGTTISWSSDNTAVVSNAGVVTRPVYGSGDATVTMTATIARGSETDTVVFNLTVKQLPPTDAQAVAADKASLTWDNIKGSNTAQNNVMGNLTQPLPSTGASGTTISWSSNNTAVVSNAGVVTRPTYGSGDATVTLTATISKSGTSDTKTFVLVIKEAAQTNAQAVAADKTSLTWDNIKGANTAQDSVTGNLTRPLPSAGASGTTISWSSNNTTVVSNTGVVTRPVYGSGDVFVTLTATISKSGTNDTKIFVLVVKEAAQTNAQAVTADKTSLTWDNIKGANTAQNNVTGDLTRPLPSAGALGTTIAWSSNNNAIVSNTGVVTRPVYGSDDATVTLTAIISKNGASDTKTFVLVVKEAAQTNAQAVAADKTALTWNNIKGSNTAQNNVTGNLTQPLPSAGASGTTISWSSDNTAAVSNAGVVTRPVYGSGDAYVTLTATISKNGTSDLVVFNLTVKQPSQGPTYTVTVNGTKIGTFEVGATVILTAGPAPAGKRFKKWNVTAGGPLTLSLNGTFNMPSKDVTVVAEWENIPANLSVRTYNMQYKKTVQLVVPTDTAGMVTYRVKTPNAKVTVSSSGLVTSTKAPIFSFNKGSNVEIEVLTDGVVTDTATIKIQMNFWKWLLVILLFGWLWY